jgi:4-hydroxy-2-oxoheptanedioate aldolase
MRKNKMRQALGTGQPLFGMAVYTSSPTLVEVIGYSGFDFIFVDSEHTPLAIDGTFEHLMRAADVSGLATVVRLKGNDEHMIRNALEMGAGGIVVPHMKTRADAEFAVKASRLAPIGIRGASADVRSAQYGAGDFDWPAYIRQTNEDTVVVGLAEDKEFFDNIDEILSVKGVDMINFGPTDLAMSMGLSLLYQMDVPAIRDAFDLLVDRAKKYGTTLMCPAAPPTLEQARKLADAGVRAIILRNDIVNFKLMCKQYVDQIIIPVRGK